MAFQDYFGTPIAYDPTEDRLVADATFTVHAIDDTSLSTPLQVVEPGSGATIPELRSSSIGVLPDFRVAGDPAQVLIKSGSFVTSLTSVYGAVLNAGLDPDTVASAIQAGTDATAARDVATSAADDAVAAAEAAQAVPATNDGIMAAVAADSGSAFAGQLNASIVERVGVELATNGAVVSPFAGLRILPTQVGETPPAGDGLVVYYEIPGNVYYKDFSADTAGGAQPSGMTKLLAANMLVRAYAGGTGGNVGQTDNPGTVAYAVDAAAADPYVEDAEFLVRFYLGTGHGLSVFFNVDPVADSFDRISYNRVSPDGRVRWTARRSGANVTAPEVSVPLLPQNSWCMLRARYQKNVISGKVWVETDPEPTGWQYSRAVGELTTPLLTGPHGVGSVDTTIRVDQITVATGGRTAVKP